LDDASVRGIGCACGVTSFGGKKVKALTKVDLNTVDPSGRVDVLVYKLAEQGARLAEAKYGLKGIWDNVKPHVHDLVTKNISNLDIPPEAKMLLSIIQANFQHKEGN
jgi:hypothetical protein